jgi:hypothetical protein
VEKNSPIAMIATCTTFLMVSHAADTISFMPSQIPEKNVLIPYHSPLKNSTKELNASGMVWVKKVAIA